MALVPFKSSIVELESLDAGPDFLSCDSLAAMAESQRELFHSQIHQLERLVVKQCQLTSVNPLAQEMAAGALSIKIGKKPKDLLNPKAVKHMQSVFSLKDNIGKKETREISALCGVTVRQVNDFIASQRSRVRKFIRLSREKASRLESSKTPVEILGPTEGANVNHETFSASRSLQQEDMCANPETVGTSGSVQKEALCLNSEAMVSSRTAQKEVLCLNSDAMAASESVQKEGVCIIPGTVGSSGSVQKEGVCVNPEMVGASGSVQKEGLCVNPVAVGALRSVQKEGDVGSTVDGKNEEEGGINEEDKKIVEDMISLMSKETSFSAQVRLMESVLRINNEAVLCWFIVKEGLAILLTWLAEAAAEEQTSVILVIFKVLCHLPLNKAQTTQISAILQAINRLRFYRTSDISNRAKVLLSKWSKLLRSQLLKKNPNDSQKDLIRKQRIRELLRGQPWNSEIGFPDDILALAENGDDKIQENRRTLRLLNAPYEDLTKKNGTGPSVLKNKVRRKVLLVEQPERNGPNRNAVATTRVARTAYTTNSRPLSADDIQKAKLRASYLQQKHGVKPDLNPKSDEKLSKLVQPLKKPVPVSRTVEQPDIDPLNLMDRLNRAKIRWQTPPEVKIDPTWQVCTGENSKESAVQTQRIRRGSEIFYPDPLTIPPNPKDPWDKELDFDDSLTPEIPIDQPSDLDPIQLPEEPASSSSQSVVTGLAGSSLQSGPDMELLAVLLKNPELVFALTSGQGTGLSSEQMVALLDTLKNSGLTLSDLANGLANSKRTRSGSVNESLPASLPSPIPPSPLERANWKSGFPTHNTAMKQTVPSPVLSPPVASATNHYNSVVSGFNGQNQSNILSLPQMTVSMNSPAHHFTSLHSNNILNAPTLHQQNPYLGQNVSNHQNMLSWDQNVGYLHVQNGYDNTTHVMPGPTWDTNQNRNQNQDQVGSGTDVWGQGRIGESSAVWGYNGQRNYNNGQGWRR